MAARQPSMQRRRKRAKCGVCRRSRNGPWSSSCDQRLSWRLGPWRQSGMTMFCAASFVPASTTFTSPSRCSLCGGLSLAARALAGTLPTAGGCQSTTWDPAKLLCHHVTMAQFLLLHGLAWIILLQDQLKWRSEAQVDTVLTDFDFSEEREEFFKWYPEGFYGTDRMGRPIYVQQPGKIDTVELWKCTTLERCIRYHLQQQERYWRIIAPACSVAAGQLREQSLVIIDMDGMGITTMSSEVRSIMATVMKIDQDYFPELMWKACLINAPVSFRVIWAMIKHLMDARTQAKIEVLGSNYQEELLRLIPPENLMECYGGTSKAPLWAEIGPWKDPAVMVQVELRRQQRIREAGRPASMSFPAVPGAEGSAEAAAEAGDTEDAGASADEGISKGSAVAYGAFQEAS